MILHSMALLAALMAALMAGAGMARAEGGRAGDFDYYVLSLSWSATWCNLTGDDRADPQCDRGRKLDFTLHGLWPQHDQGYPSYCRTAQPDPTRSDTAAMSDIMGGAGLAFYEWKKHGRCSGLSPRAYFTASRRAYDSVTIPPVLQGLSKRVELPASVVEDAFIEANPQLSRNGITVTCDAGMIAEVRICLTRDLAPRDCAADIRRDCTLSDAVIEPVR